MYPSETAEKFVIRLPDGMRDRVRQRAAANRRSMNSEIVHVLDLALEAEKAKGPAGADTPPSRGSNNPRKEKASDQVE